MKLPGLNKSFDFVADEMVKKLILLFIFEKMEFPLTDESINEIVSRNPDWMTYMDYREALFQLIESKFILQSTKASETCFTITNDGRGALSHFYQKIPASIREEILKYAAENRGKLKRRQEYTWDYFKNTDGTYTVVLRILDQSAGDNLLEIKFKTASRASAKAVANKWREKASTVYEMIYLLTTEESQNK
jgi:hypothetical protein